MYYISYPVYFFISIIFSMFNILCISSISNICCICYILNMPCILYAVYLVYFVYLVYYAHLACVVYCVYPASVIYAVYAIYTRHCCGLYSVSLGPGAHVLHPTLPWWAQSTAWLAADAPARRHQVSGTRRHRTPFPCSELHS